MTHELYMPKDRYIRKELRIPIEDYRGLCTIDVREDEKGFTLTFTGCMLEPVQLMKDFRLYVDELIEQGHVPR